MFRKLIIPVLFIFVLVLSGCPTIESNISSDELNQVKKKNIENYDHTWKYGKTYTEYKNPEIKGTVLFFTYEINADTKKNFSSSTVNNIYEVTALVLQAEKKFKPQGINFFYIDSMKMAELFRKFKAKTPPVVVVLDNTGTQIHRFNPAARSMITKSFSSDFSLAKTPSQDKELASSGMVDTVNRTLALELDNVLEFLVND